MGLYHGIIGTVLDIVYERKEGPHYKGSEKKKQPMYVLVDFPQCCGPIFYDSKSTELKSEKDTKRTWVPVPSVLGRFSNNGACAKLYMPLSLAFGKTIHSFQGASVGKKAPERPDNAFKRIVRDPGTRQFESINPGIFYTLLSRATTFGEEKNQKHQQYFLKGRT